MTLRARLPAVRHGIRGRSKPVGLPRSEELATRFLEGVGRIPGVRLIGIADPDRVDERTPTFAIRVEGQHPQATSAELARRGIFTWDGHYYAIEVFDRLGLLDSGGAVRIGFCHYHTPDEVDRVLQGLAELPR